jgi:hypothetical protein
MPKITPASEGIALTLIGDIGGMTFIQKAGQHRIAYAKTYPKKTASAGQRQQRSKFHEAIIAWRTLEPEQKQTLDDITNRKRMIMSGYNLFISMYLNHSLEWITEYAEELNLPW